MPQFVRFSVDDVTHFEALRSVFTKIKSVKNLDYEIDPNIVDSAETSYDIDAMRQLMPAPVQSNFDWPASSEIAEHKLDLNKPIRLSAPGALRGARWSLVRILDLIDTCEYSLDRCELIDRKIGELHVETHAYPYGGLNALIALVEGFGFNVVGVNECGVYEPIIDAR